MLGEVKWFVEQHKNEEIAIIEKGHIMGAAVATEDMVFNGINKGFSATAFLFASPRAWDENFKKIFSKL